MSGLGEWANDFQVEVVEFDEASDKWRVFLPEDNSVRLLPQEHLCVLPVFPRG